jgi:Cu(I)-responsive transcriptional regulator
MEQFSRSSGESIAAQTQALSIGEAAKLTGISAKMIRHYESLGLVSPANRTSANYRVYQTADLQLLSFIKSARDLGFSIKQIAQLSSLWKNAGRSSAEVKKLAIEHIDDMDERIHALQKMRKALSDLANRCQGDEHPDCPILDGLACASQQVQQVKAQQEQQQQ